MYKFNNCLIIIINSQPKQVRLHQVLKIPIGSKKFRRERDTLLRWASHVIPLSKFHFQNYLEGLNAYFFNMSPSVLFMLRDYLEKLFLTSIKSSLFSALETIVFFPQNKHKHKHICNFFILYRLWNRKSYHNFEILL